MGPEKKRRHEPGLPNLGYMYPQGTFGYFKEYI